VPSATQEEHQEQEAIMTEAMTTTTIASTEEVHVSAFIFNEQMVEELLGPQSDPLSDLPFVMGESVFTTSSSSPSASIPPDTQPAHDEAIMVEIDVEMASAALGSGIGGGMVGPGLAPLRMVSPDSKIIIIWVLCVLSYTKCPHPSDYAF
jgi:hypothetical protein